MSDSSRVVDLLDTETSCPVCNAEFLDSEDLNVHRKQHSLLGDSSQTRFCNTCLITFPDIEYYSLHIINNHLSTSVSCKYCTRVFYDRLKLKHHERKHNANSSPRISCSQCACIFYSKIELEIHEFNEHADVGEGIMLQKCFSTLSSLLNMNVRRFFTVPYENRLYCCASCNITTHNVDKYIEHLHIENVKSFTCEDCCRVFSSKYNMIRHMQSRHCHNYMQPTCKLHCEKCNKSINEAFYKKHIKHCLGDTSKINIQSIDHSLALNTKAAPIQPCKFCYRPFVGTTALKKHVERIHKNSLHLYKYLCLTCDVVFKHPRMLFSHYFTKHKDLKPYTCKICNVKFRIRRTFTLHIKLNHKSIGYVEFDENYQVFFTDTKSENPFHPRSQHTQDYIKMNGTTAKRKSKPEPEITTAVKDSEKPPQDKDESGTDSDINTEICVTLEREYPKNNEEDQDFDNSYLEQAIKTEGEPTKIESKKKKRRKRRDHGNLKTKKPKFQSIVEVFDSDSTSDDSNMPLFQLKNRVESKQKKNRKQFNVVQSYIPKKYKFLCTVCNKNCYTYQNYHDHLSLHKKYKRKRCIKCNKTFKSKLGLLKHIQEKHSSSQLTETLKQLLERRKNNIYMPKDHKTIAEGLRKTIKKVEVEKNIVSAVITPLDNKLSVKNFLENFTPDTDSMSKDVTLSNSVTVKLIKDQRKTKERKSPTLKIMKLNQELIPTKVKPKMPVKFKVNPEQEQAKVTIKIAQGPLKKSKLCFTHQVVSDDHYEVPSANDDVNDNTVLNSEVHNDNDVHHDNDVHFDNNTNNNDDIPEEVQEIMLNIEDIQQNIIIPNLPKNYSYMRIAHLQSQAPYYKIVKLNDIKKPKKKIETAKPVASVTLPDGTKLVNVNPLAHLMQNIDIKQIFKETRTSYEPKTKDIKTAIVRALETKPKPKKKSKFNLSADNIN